MSCDIPVTNPSEHAMGPSCSCPAIFNRPSLVARHVVDPSCEQCHPSQVTNIGADSLDIAAALDRYGKVVYAVAKAGHNDPLPKSVATKFATTYGDGVVALGDFTSVGQGLVAYQDVSGSLAPELPDILQPGESYNIFLIPVRFPGTGG